MFKQVYNCKYYTQYIKCFVVQSISDSLSGSEDCAIVPILTAQVFVIFVYKPGNLKTEQDVFVKHNAPDNGQFKRSQDHKDKYFDTSRNILSQEMTVQYESSSILSTRSYDQCQFFF